MKRYSLLAFSVLLPTMASGQASYEPKYTEYTITSEDYGRDLTFRMIDVQGGSFMMGIASDDPYESATPQHEVNLSDFAIGEFEVTQGLWVFLMESWPVSPSGVSWMESGSGCDFDYPAYYVSYNDALEFIAALNKKLHADGQLHPDDFFRLPTEAEWEFAARGGNLSQGYSFAGSNVINEVAVWNQVAEFNLVGQLKPNELGLYDMSGNVREWCSDYWKNSYEGADSVDPQGPTLDEVSRLPGMIQRVQRGGDKDSRYSDLCRVDDRSSFRPDMSAISSGMRLVLQRHAAEIPQIPQESQEPSESVEIHASHPSATLSPTDSELLLTSLPLGAPLRIFSANGECLHQSTATSTTLSFNTGHWAKGVYFVRVGDVVLRVLI